MSDIGASETVVNGADLTPPPDLDKTLHDIYERNHVTNGAERGDDGKFTNTETPSGGEAAPSAAASSPPPEGEGAGAEGADPTLAAQSVPLPANWRGLEQTWEKVPADLRAEIAAHEGKLHQTLSTQGQQIAAFKPINDFIAENQDIFGRKKEDGSAVVPRDIFNTLIGHQRIIERDPIQGVLNIVGSYGISPQQLVNAIAERFKGQKGPDPVAAELAELKRTISQIADPKAIDTRVSAKLAEERATQKIEDTMSRWSKDKPLYGALTKDEATEAEFVNYITMARQKLGDTAEITAVLDRAYDMAVNADPDLRAKAAAAKAAAQAEPNKAAEARRAQQVNVTSTSSGKQREPELDDKLRAIWRENHKG